MNYHVIDLPLSSSNFNLTCNTPVAVCASTIYHERHIVNEYSKRAINLGLSLFELLSEALGLNPSHLKDMDCAQGLLLLGNYY